MNGNFISLEIDAARVCDGLSRIGYTPATALCDIIDNSVQAGAKNIWLQIVRETNKADSAKNNVREYRIIDNGNGMSKDQILSALQLGSSDQHYSVGSLSKFGLGLKSASFSQGEILEIISRDSNAVNFIKYRVSLPIIRAEKKYLVEECPLNQDDADIINLHLNNLVGTIVRIRDVRKINHPPVKKTVEALKERVGVIYYYFMAEDGLSIKIDSDTILPKDPLFVDEANGNGDLDEQDWEGTSVRWISRPKTIVLDIENQVKATIEATNLVHPPTFKLSGGENARLSAREKYMIGAGQHGYYVYRNKRLIAWAERFDGMISPDQDLYAFRGRIILDSTADDVVNIDVKKSRIQLSDEAYDAIDNLSADFTRKSKAAWGTAKKIIEDIPREDTHTQSNIIAANTYFPDELPGEPDDEKTNIEKKRREDEVNKKLIQKEKEDLGHELNPLEDSQDKEIVPRLIELVDVTKDNLLWDMYHDATYGTKVRINKHHRFSKLIYDLLGENKQLSIVMDNFFLTLVHSEKHVIKTTQDVKVEIIENVMNNFKEIATQFLTKSAQAIDKEIGKVE